MRKNTLNPKHFYGGGGQEAVCIYASYIGPAIKRTYTVMGEA